MENLRILYATDDSPPSIDAGKLLIKVARKSNIDVTVLHVMPEISLYDPRREVSEARAKAQSIVDRAAGLLTEHGYAAQIVVAEGGDPSFVISRKSRDYDLALLGPSSSSWLGGVLGSVSRSILHSSNSSLLLVHYALQSAVPARVLVGSDGSAGASYAISTAIRLLDPDRTKVTVLSVAELPIQVPPPPLVPVPESLAIYQAEEEASAIDRAEAIAANGAEAFRASGFDAAEITIRGGARHALLKELYDKEYDLAVVGSRKLGGVSRALLGSISEPIARKAAAALVVRQPDTS